MPRTVTVGYDGSSESRAAAEWAAREALLRGLPLRLVNVREPIPGHIAESDLMADGTFRERAERLPREAGATLRARHPELEVVAEQIPGGPMEVLPEVAKDADLLVLGSRGLSGIGGFLVGSVGMVVIAHTTAPVVLVRAATSAKAAGPVVVGVDTDKPNGTVLAFAFEEAARRGAVLKAVHGWTVPPYYAYVLPAYPALAAELGEEQSHALTEVLRPWREKFPDVEVAEESRAGSAAVRIVDAARDASLVVVGRRIRRGPIGAHIGPVTHAVLHHATAPVAVVAHD
ncbi:universal stress protein [Streptomyces sp. SMS_SU21]|uniref:universal stress protein n=1 Tax=Streptomyces sp. SMS_SU21 TaxID=2069440 RepID=UPI000C88D9BA|nr:universal stress protein [Streptomyces sp. SMS_SU21]MCA2204737.1 universal stress protein [Streptomyces sp. SMS_SU21]